MAKGQKGGTVKVDTLATEQLHHLSKQIERDLERLNRSAQVLTGLATQYSQSGSAVQELQKVEEGEQMMVPLTESLYVAGTVYQKDKVLVNIGTGYFVERSCDDAIDFCKRNVDNVSKQLDAIGEEIRNKQGGLNQVNSVFNQRMREAKAQEAAAQANAVTKKG